MQFMRRYWRMEARMLIFIINCYIYFYTVSLANAGMTAWR